MSKNHDAGVPDQIITTRAALAAAMRAAIDEYFSEPRVSGPKPRETGVCRIIAETIDRVSGES